MPAYRIDGYGRDADRERSKVAGFERHIIKPVDLEVLLRLANEESMERSSEE
jgi:hypothetical protein